MIVPADTLSVTSQVSKEGGWDCGRTEAAGPSASIQDYKENISQRLIFLTPTFHKYHLLLTKKMGQRLGN